ncbi:hypothetical protein BsLM_2016 [Bacillus sp. LM 4-2]|nr:hypothetical protein BsLM_2016 [Bacillus sp. LM 4-2]
MNNNLGGITLDDVCMLAVIAVIFAVFWAFVKWCDFTIGGGEKQ